MFASQLLRILQTMPNDVKYETRDRVFDPDERSSSMKGSQDSRFFYSESFGRKAESVSFGNREMYQKRAFEENFGNEHWSAKSVNGFSKDPDGGTKDFPRKEDQNGLLCHLSGENGDSDSLSSETKDEDNSWRSREFECSMMVEESKHGDEDDIQDSGHILISASSFMGPDSDVDNIKLDFDLPELEVCYKETNDHIVRDVCADEIMPVEENILIENGNYSHCEDPEGRVGEEPVILDGLTDSFLKNTKRVGADDSGSKEETKDVLLEEGKPKSSADSSLEKDTAKDHDPDDSLRTEKNVNDALGEATFVVSSLPIQEFGTRSFLRSFLNYLDIAENNIVQPRNDKLISFGESVSESFAVSSAEAEQKEEIQAGNMLYRSRVERRSITFNFNSPVPVIPEDMIESQDLHEHESFSETCKYSTGNISDRSLDAYSSNSSSTSPVHFIVNEDTSNEKGHETSPDEQDTRSVDLSTDDHVQIFSSKIPSPPNNSGQEIEPHFPKHERGNSDNVVSQTRYDEADLSHSVASFIMFSGPIEYSGSLSLRSDGSATSTRSFAFPVLHSEENRSPVRMENTDLRLFQKHKNWKSGLLCCRF